MSDGPERSEGDPGPERGPQSPPVEQAEEIRAALEDADASWAEYRGVSYFEWLTRAMLALFSPKASDTAAAVPSPPAEPLSARLAANQPLIRRMLLDAWHDLRWYRVNAKEHPGHAGRTIEALEAALQASAPEGPAGFSEPFDGEAPLRVTREPEEIK